MKIYNTLTGRKEIFVPIKENEIKMYICGPTVYNLMHVGNARFCVVFDTVRRYLDYKGYAVTLVQNFTDVDDKIIQRAVEEGKTPEAVAETFIDEAFTDTDGLNIKRAAHYPRVTGEMDEIIAMIQKLVDKGYAYVNNGSVFFETTKSEGYGKLSKKNIDDLVAGARVEVNDDKRSPADFVLWKPDKPGEPKWDSPWGTGRPGWHIECSAMAKKYLGDQIDIHGGGEDLIFPHHENEIAQSEAANGVQFVNYWMHNGALTSGHKKMSKSLGNFFTLREVAEKFPYEVIRFFLLTGHYRMPMEFSDKLLQAAQNGLDRIKNARALLEFISQNASSDVLSEEEIQWLSEAERYRTDFEASMEDDFNTADAITAVYELVKFINTHVNANRPDEVSVPFAQQLLRLLEELCGLLGLTLKQEAANTDITAEIETLIAKRQEARKNKDWGTADQIRNELLQRGIVLEDTAGGVRWSFKGSK